MGSLGTDGHGDNHLIAILLRGLQGPCRSRARHTTARCRRGNSSPTTQIAAILTYIRSEWGNNAGPITAEQVAKLRAETESRAEPWTQGALMEIAPAKLEAPAAAPAPAGQAAPPAPAAPAPAAPSA